MLEVDSEGIEKELQLLDSELANMKIIRLIEEIKEHNKEIDRLILNLQSELNKVKK